MMPAKRIKREILSMLFDALKLRRKDPNDKYNLGKCFGFREILVRLGYNYIDLLSIDFVGKELQKIYKKGGF